MSIYLLFYFLERFISRAGFIGLHFTPPGGGYAVEAFYFLRGRWDRGFNRLPEASAHFGTCGSEVQVHQARLEFPVVIFPCK